MISLFARLFIKNRSSIRDLSVRRAYGVLCSVVGIALNILLFAGKYTAGLISGSIAVTADAFNNLSDAGSSVITLIGFKFAGMKADKNHPFGHGRIEYIAGFIVSVLIIIMGFELGKSSVMKIISPEPVEAGVLTIVILAASICVKIYMGIYNRAIGKKIGSSAMRATSMDSFSDTVATLAVLISALVSRYTHYNIDGM
jgi:cation diffusion facilitator family transporter